MNKQNGKSSLARITIWYDKYSFLSLANSGLVRPLAYIAYFH